jgi:hypothetical protein
MWQRLCWRLENLGFLFAFAILDVLAIVSFTPQRFRAGLLYFFTKNLKLETFLTIH